MGTVSKCLEFDACRAERALELAKVMKRMIQKGLGARRKMRT